MILNMEAQAETAGAEVTVGIRGNVGANPLYNRLPVWGGGLFQDFYNSEVWEHR